MQVGTWLEAACELRHTCNRFPKFM